MSIKHVWRLVALLGVVLGATSYHPPTRAQETDMPFIQYYDRMAGGIVIERADGSERRIISSAMVQPNHDMIMGGGWSPSGEWVAWQSYLYAFESTTLHGLSVVNAADGSRLTLFDALTGISQVTWSPTDDILLIGNEIEPSYRRGAESTVYYLVDVAAEKILTQMEVPRQADATWSPDGERVLIEQRVYASEVPMGVVVGVVDLVGNVENFKGATTLQQARWLSDGRLIYFDMNDATLYHADFVGNPKAYRLPRLTLEDVRFHPDFEQMPYAILYMRGEDQTRRVWMLNVLTGATAEIGYSDQYARFLADGSAVMLDAADQLLHIVFETETVTPILDDVPNYIVRGNVVFYWEAGLRLVDLATGDAERIYASDVPLFSDWLNVFVSPNGQWVIVPNPREQKLQVYHRATQTLTTLGLGYDERTPIDNYSVVWFPQSDRAYIEYGYGEQTTTQWVDLATGHLTPMPDRAGYFSIAPDERTVIYRGKCDDSLETWTLCVQDLATDEIHAAPLHSQYLESPFRRNGWVDTEWHPSGEWAIVSQYYGAYRGSPYPMIVRRDGTVMREIGGGCTPWLSDLCFGWYIP